MSITQVVGIDPGLVDTGVVSIGFHPLQELLVVDHEVIAGPDAQAAVKWLTNHALASTILVFVEKYRPRQNLGADERMVKAEQEFHRAMPYAAFVPNTGAKKIITKDLMEVLEVWDFPTSTHHQDLRSAARIALLGMVKYEQTNRLLSDVVQAYLDRKPWRVVHA